MAKSMPFLESCVVYTFTKWGINVFFLKKQKYGIKKVLMCLQSRKLAIEQHVAYYGGLSGNKYYILRYCFCFRFKY